MELEDLAPGRWQGGRVGSVQTPVGDAGGRHCRECGGPQKGGLVIPDSLIFQGIWDMLGVEPPGSQTWAWNPKHFSCCVEGAQWAAAGARAPKGTALPGGSSGLSTPQATPHLTLSLWRHPAPGPSQAEGSVCCTL